jgi:eukaryotic-like serine/threonine-protein kinase
VTDLRVGQIVGDRYRIDALLGAGGMGMVVAATHVELGQRVAIKFLLDVHEQTVARFQREGRLLVRLKSPHVARVIDVDVLEDDTPYIVMEHLEGQDLADLTGAVGRLPYAEVVDYVLQACDAIAEAHALGIVHRDLKPANVFLSQDRRGTRTVKVLDFGISKLVQTDQAPTSSDLTSEGVAIGSAGYMAPEQISNARDVDARADIYSLGALMYALMAGAPPHDGDSPFAILAAMMTTPLTPLCSLVPDAPPGLGAAVERCLAQDPEARWPTVAHFAQALAPFATPRGHLYIKQISATLGVALPEAIESLDTVALPPPNAGAQHRSVPPAAPARAPNDALPSVPPQGTPRPFVAPTLHSETSGTAARRKSSLALILAGGLGVVAVLFAGTAWKMFQAAKPTPTPPVATEIAPPTPAVLATTAAEPSAAPAPMPAPSEASLPSTVPSTPAIDHAPRPGRPRVTPRVTGSAPDPSRPPTPAMMPPSRR